MDRLAKGDIDAANLEWSNLLESWMISEFGQVSDFRLPPPPRGRPLPLRQVRERWEVRADQTLSRANLQAHRLLGAVKDLRASISRWLRLIWMLKVR